MEFQSNIVVQKQFLAEKTNVRTGLNIYMQYSRKNLSKTAQLEFKIFAQCFNTPLHDYCKKMNLYFVDKNWIRDLTDG